MTTKLQPTFRDGSGPRAVRGLALALALSLVVTLPALAAPGAAQMVGQTALYIAND